MNLQHALHATVIVALGGLLSSSPLALEATAGNHDADANAAFAMRLETVQALLTAAINELTHRVDVCTAEGKLYGPTHPDRNANGCVIQVTSSTIPDADQCDAGSPLVSNGSEWTCQKTFTSPQCNGVACLWNSPTTAATGNKFCQTQGYSAMSAHTYGGGGCEDCAYMKWAGAWQPVYSCDTCRPFQTVTCY